MIFDIRQESGKTAFVNALSQYDEALRSPAKRKVKEYPQEDKSIYKRG